MSGSLSDCPSARPRRVGLVGLGTIAAYYLRAFDRVPGWELAAVCDPRTDALRPHRDRAAVFRDHRDMLGMSSLDGVVVTAPNDAHAPISRDALDAGLAVCVEKPLAVGLADGRDLAARASPSATLFTAFHRRYNENVHRLLRSAGERGGVESVRVRYFERIEEHIGGDAWYLDASRCGGGCVADNGPNAFDLVRLFLGEVLPDGVSITRDERGVDRQASVRLRSAAGAPALVELDWSHPGETKDVQVRFADGTVDRADMLAGFDGFKSSLWHEYRGVLRAFGSAIGNSKANGNSRANGSSGAVGGSGASGDRERSDGGDGGLAALELVAQTYANEQHDPDEQIDPDEEKNADPEAQR